MTLRPRTAPTTSVLRFEPNTALNVRLVETPKPPAPPRPWLRPLIGGLILAMLVYAFLAVFYVFPRTYIPSTNVQDIPNLALVLSYPNYLAFGDTGDIEITIVNHGATITGTVVLEFAGTMPVRTAPSKSTTIELKDFKRGASQTERLTISLNRPIWLRADDAQFQVFVETDGKRGALPDACLIHAAPVPYLGTSLAWLPTGSALLSGLLTFLWGTFTKRVLVMEGK